MAFEHRRLLKLAADAELGDIGFVLFRQVDRILEDHLTRIRSGLAGDDIHHRRFARAVWADDGAKLARLNHQRQRVDRLEPVEGDGNVFEIEQAFASGFGNRVHRLTPLPEPVA
ncbi:hypothetical protein D3C87_1792870 [compost metagenome]